MRLTVSTIVFTCVLAVAALAQAVPISLGNIMPLGDSITAGYTQNGGYRQQLYKSLNAAGCVFRFVGNETTYPVDILTTTGNEHHEGHNGYTIAQINDGIANGNWLDVNPDIILLHIGANDMLQTNTAAAPSRLDALLGAILAKRPSCRIIVAKIIGGSTVSGDSRAATYDGQIAAYNTAIEKLVNTRAAAGDPVSMIDMYSLLNITRQTDSEGHSLFADISHPNQAGYDIMGKAWADAVCARAAPEPGALVMAVTVLVGLLAYAWRK